MIAPIAPALAAELEDRLVRYVQIETTSDETSPTVPSTPGQWTLLRLLAEELAEIGAANVTLTETGFVFATLPATLPPAAEAGASGAAAAAAAGPAGPPVVAFLAHVDTVAGIAAGDVHPRVHRHYDGAPIVFPEDALLVLMPEISPYLASKIGDDIVTASGGSILGADDKAGVAILMTFANHLLRHPEIAHGEIRLCFTPDEEIGTGIRHIDLGLLGAQFAYTLDGGDVGEIVYETFSADKAVVTLIGVSAHPGSAKGVLVNALTYAATIADTLPHATRTPETTDERAGFLHLYKVEGTAAEARMHFILRDFEREGLAEHGELLRSVCNAVQLSEPRLRIDCTITPQYRNMRYWLENDMRPVDLAVQAMAELGIAPIHPPVRGGTDGSQLTEMGTPTPNLFTGMQAVHSQLEWVSVQDMAKSVQVLVRLSELWAQA